MTIENDPVLREAMRLHGIASYKDFEINEDDEIHVIATRDAPAIRIANPDYPRGLGIIWHNMERPVRYEVDDEGAIVTIPDTVFPEAVLTALSGRPLSDVIKMPGAENMIIDQAVVSNAFPGNPLDLRMSLLNS